MGRSFFLTEELHDYLVASSTPADDILLDLQRETAALGGVAQMQVAPEQGAFLTVFTAAIAARRVVEVGTFTGYSALCLARGLPADGRLECFDVSAEWTDVARRYWDRAGVSDRITLTLGPAADSLAALPPDPVLDLAFIDADKPGYPAYVELLLPRLRSGGVLLLDNTLRGGAVLPSRRRTADKSTDEGTNEGTQVIADLNAALAQDPRVDVVLLPIADGLTMVRKRT
jgi:predicted O-methyltransferase YrrM